MQEQCAVGLLSKINYLQNDLQNKILKVFLLRNGCLMSDILPKKQKGEKL